MNENKQLSFGEQQIHTALTEIASRIAELSHCGEEDFSFDEIAEEMQSDFPALLRQSLAEVLAVRKDVETAKYFPIDVPYQPDITVRTRPLQELRLVSPLNIRIIADAYTEEEEHLCSWDAVHCQREINDFIAEYAEPEEEHRGLMVYYPENSAVSEKVFSAFPCVEVIDGRLMGVLKCQICGTLTPEEMTELKEWWHSQASDGWGEGFEQNDIATKKFGSILVSFGGSGSIQDIREIPQIINNTADKSEEESPEISGISMS